MCKLFDEVSTNLSTNNLWRSHRRNIFYQTIITGHLKKLDQQTSRRTNNSPTSQKDSCKQHKFFNRMTSLNFCPPPSKKKKRKKKKEEFDSLKETSLLKTGKQKIFWSQNKDFLDITSASWNNSTENLVLLVLHLLLLLPLILAQKDVSLGAISASWNLFLHKSAIKYSSNIPISKPTLLAIWTRSILPM